MRVYARGWGRLPTATASRLPFDGEDALSNRSGFGGSNVALVFRRADG